MRIGNQRDAGLRRVTIVCALAVMLLAVVVAAQTTTEIEPLADSVITSVANTTGTGSPRAPDTSLITLSAGPYVAGEAMMITIDPSKVISLAIVHGDDRFKLIGQESEEIPFVPGEPGSYFIELITAEGRFSLEFDVIPEFAAEAPQDTQDAKNTPNTTNIPNTQESSPLDSQPSYPDTVSSSPLSSPDLPRDRVSTFQAGAEVKVIGPSGRAVFAPATIEERVLAWEEDDGSLGEAIERNVKVDLGDSRELQLEHIDSGTLALGYDPLSGSEISVHGKHPLNAFALDPTKSRFRSGRLNGVAVGNALWKCADWDFTARSCRGTWKQIKSLTPGQAYTIPISAEDPGFAETLELLDLQSYPIVGGNWSVRFTTIGTADLQIRASNGTTWDYDSETEDLRFLSLTCDGTPITYQWVNGSVFVPGYSCNGTGLEVSKAITEGVHIIEFRFGNETKYAKNYAAATGILMLRDSTGGQSLDDATVGTDINWDVQDRIDPSYAHNNGQSNITVNTAGIYRISYGLYLEQTIADNRLENHGRIQVNGADAGVCWSQVYTREAATDEGALTSDCLISLSSGDEIELNIFRSSTNSRTVSSVADKSWFHMQLLDNPQVAMIRDVTGGDDFNSYAGTIVDWSNYDRLDSPFLFSNGGDNITVNQDGLYRVTYGVGVQQTTGRYNARGHLLVNGLNVTPGYTTTYCRDSTGADEGVLTADALLELKAGDYVQVIVEKETSDTTTNAAGIGGRMWFQMELIPNADANVIMVSDPIGGQSINTLTGINVTFETTNRSDSFFTKVDADTIRITEDGYYRLAYGTYAIRGSGGTRFESFTNVRVNGVDEPVCWSSAYLRGEQSAGNTYEGGDFASCILNLSATDTLEIRSGRVSSSVATTLVGNRSWWYIQALDAINEPPDVALVSPAASTTIDTRRAVFTVNASDDKDTTFVCDLYINSSGSLQSENTTTVTSGVNATMFLTLPDGDYEWDMLCNDSDGASAFAPLYRNVTVNAARAKTDHESLNVTVINQTAAAKLSMNVTHKFTVLSVIATMRFPNSTVENYSLTFVGGNAWEMNFSNTNKTGKYNFTRVFVTDVYNVTNETVHDTLVFTVTPSPPLPFELLTPVDLKESQNLLPNLAWQQTAEEYFDNYTILLDKDSSFASPDFTYHNLRIDNTSRIVDFSLDANEIYYWRVIAYDVFGTPRNSTSDFRYITDTIAPKVVLNQPLNAGIEYSNVVTFNYTPSDANTIRNCTLYHNASGQFTRNATNDTVTNGMPNYLSSELADGEYLWSVTCADYAGNMNESFTDNRTVIVDLIPPNITLVAPPNNSYENTTNNLKFTVRTFDIKSDVASCTLVIDDSVEQTETSITDGIAFNFTTFVFNGNHIWYVNCTDDGGHTAMSETRNITIEVIDKNPPFITLNSPPADGFLSIPTVEFNYTVEDATGVENCSLQLDGRFNTSNATTIINFEPNYFTVSGLTETEHNWTVECYDNSTELNKGAASAIYFTVDLTDPMVALSQPPDNTYATGSNITFRYTPTDLNLDDCALYGNFSGPWEQHALNTSPTSGVLNSFLKSSLDGIYLWNVYCNDSSGRGSFAANNYTIKVDTTPPRYTNNLTAPSSPITYTPDKAYRFNITWTDAFAVSKVYFEHNISGTLQNETVTSPGNNVYNYTVTDLPAGLYLYRWYAEDENGNINQTIQYQYFVQRATAEVNLFLNGTDSNFSIDEDNTVNITATMITPSQGYVELFFNKVLTNNGSVPLSNITFFGNPGIYNFTAIYPMTQNYTAHYETHFLIVNDTTAPNVTLLYPDPYAYVGSNDVTFQYRVSDFNPIVNCSIYINGSLNVTEYSITRNITETFDIYLPDANYSFNVTCYDNAGNMGRATEREFAVLETDSITVDVGSNPGRVQRGTDADITTNTTDIFGSNLDTTVMTDIILGNASTTWWDTDWAYRKPIALSQEANRDRFTLVDVNISGINLTGCGKELRIVRDYNGIHTTVPREIIGGDDSTWCLARFAANISASAVNETRYHAYYGNTAASDPGNTTGTGYFRVQHGNIVGTGSLSDTIHDVTLDNAFVLFSPNTESSAPDQIQFTPILPATNNVQFIRYDGTSTSDLAWQVIDSSELSVQRGTTTFLAAEAEQNITLTPVDLSKTFLVVYGRTSAGSNAQNNYGFFRGYFRNSTTITLERTTTGATATVSWQVVSWEGANVQNGNFSSTASTASVDIAKVNLSRSFIIFSRAVNGDDSLNTNSIEASFFNASRLTFSRDTNVPASTFSVGWSVIELPEGYVVQSGPSDGGADRNVTITEVGLNRSFHHESWSNTGSGTTYRNTLNRVYLANSTTLAIDKSSTGQTSFIEWFVVEDQTASPTVALGAEEKFIARNQSDTGGDATWTWNWNTAGYSYGNYTAASHANKTGFKDAVGVGYFDIIPDVTPPNITLWLPKDYYEQGVGYVDFMYEPSDPNLDDCVLYFGKLGGFDANVSNSTPANEENNTFSNIHFGIGVWDWNVWCNDTEGNAGFADQNFTLNISGPDLSPISLWFENIPRIEGKNITLFANITNQGLSPDTSEFVVQFFLGDPDSGGTQISGNRTFSSLAVAETQTINVTYILQLSTNDIFVTVDPDNRINESDEGNNKKNQTIWVGLYQYFYGNVTSTISLDNSQNKSFISISNITNTSGHIFIADKDSRIDFSSFGALTRNALGSPTADDFTDVDTNLNITGYNDSIKQVWGLGTDVPIATENFDLTTGTIYHVPIVNSTNTSNFITGILWDETDDTSTNLQYDQADKEDLIFITKINDVNIGRYALSDYEVRVPAVLRSYKGGEDMMTIYVEII